MGGMDGPPWSLLNHDGAFVLEIFGELVFFFLVRAIRNLLSG